MFKKNLLAFSALLLLSCSSSDDSTPSCKLLSVKPWRFFHEEFENPFVSAWNPAFSDQLAFIYDSSNRISEIQGGVYEFPPGQSLNTWMYSDNVIDVFTYSNDTIKAHYNSTNLNLNKKGIFKIRNGQVLYRKVMKYSNSNEFTYTYNGNTITEHLNGFLHRTFTLSDGNLIAVDKIYYNSANQITGKKEYRFMNYDNSPNLLKGKFYIDGAFYNAFSNNNYLRIEINNYTYTNGTYQLNNGNAYSEIPPFAYDENNIAEIFEQSCE